MPTTRPTAAARRLLLVVAVAVAALLLAPVAGVDTGAAAVASGSQTSTQTASQASGETATAAARTSRKKVRKTRKKKVTPVVQETVAEGGAADDRWSGTTLSYYDGLPSQWAWSVRTAVANWNATGAGITLVPVSDPAQAQVRISYGDIGGNSGLATVGRAAGAYVKLSERYSTLPADRYDRVEVMGVMTHELGHVLGLEHVTRSCDLMGPVLDIVGCGVYDMGSPDVYRCDVIGAAAVAEAARMYGGTAAPQATGRCAVGA